MWKIAKVFVKRVKYVGNDVDMWEMAKICGKWLKYLTNELIMWEMTQRFGKMAQIFVKCLRYMGHGLSV